MSGQIMVSIFIAAVVCVALMALIYWKYTERKRTKEYTVGLGMKTEMVMEDFWTTMNASKNLKQELLKEEFENVPLDDNN